ncbi:MAG TPA: putative porin [Chitinophagaceae bacterium]|nr:putative porin [Chitinophagaceae bacterium]
MIKKNISFRIYKAGFLILSILFIYNPSFGQRPRKILDNIKDTTKNATRSATIPPANRDTTIGFKHRDDLADSITISYRYLDSLRNIRLDSSINDFNKFFSVPAHYITLGNNGSPGYSILFSPQLKAGWDPGFHAFDAYRFTLEGTRFYKTTRPYSQITYLLASGKEQFINILHTQNIKRNWNFGFEYRLISAPGFFQTQNTGHNNYRLFSNYQGNKKRYAAWLVLNGNKLAASENGGIQNDSLLYEPNRENRVSIPVKLGGDVSTSFNLFSTKIATGNVYKDFTFFLRQSYDLGKRDSIEINDSTKEYLFYPKFRFQHSFSYNTYTYRFQDTLARIDAAKADSAIFKKWYDTTLQITNGLNFFVQDKWKILTNDFSIRQFPETKNPAQFIEAGVRLENLKGTFFKGVKNYYNVAVHGEYRNKTRNKKWDAFAKGEFYATGLNAGDYFAHASLTRFLNEKFGNIQVGFQNINRSPSFIFEDQSSFNFKNSSASKKENITVLTAATENPKFTLWFRNISLTNYTYFKNYYQTDQYSSLINIAQVQAFKKFHFKLLRNKLFLYSDIIVQQTGANSPVRVPLFYTRQRLAFEGVFYKNLNLSTGFDVNYNSPYKANNYSPVMGQFFPQDSTIGNLPNVSYFFNFRIKSFTGLVKLENLNTVNFANGLNFTNNNFAAPHYPTPGLILRVGVNWRFVN